MHCETCGLDMPDAARFCPACGAATAAAGTTAAAAGTAAGGKPQTGLGGWVLVFAVCLIVGGIAFAVSGVGGLVSTAIFQSALASLLGSQAVGVIVGACAYALAVACVFLILTALLLRRSPRFLRTMQVLGVLLIIAAAVLLFLLNMTLMEQGANVIGRSALSLAGEIAALALTTLFFRKSKRARAYFGR